VSDRDKPGPVFSLDALEREGKPDPFQFAVGGERFVVEDMEERDWQDLLFIGDDPEKGLQVSLGDEQYLRFKEIRGVPSWKLQKLMEAIAEYFGLAMPGEDAGSSGS
jgi:hypothetical protein